MKESHEIDSQYLKDRILQRAYRLRDLKSSKLIISGKENSNKKYRRDFNHYTDESPCKHEVYNINCSTISRGQRVIAIATTVFDEFTYLEQTIDSILMQEPPSIPILYILKDASKSPGCKSILAKSIHKRRKDIKSSMQIVYINQADRGMYEGLYDAFELAEHYGISEDSIMGYINGDDIILKDALRTVECIINKTGAEWVTGRPNIIDALGSTISSLEHDIVFNSKDIAACKHQGSKGYPFIQQEGTFWSLELYRKAGKLNPQYKVAGDFDLWRRFAVHTHILTIQRPLASFRKRPGQQSDDMEKYRNEIKNIVESTQRSNKYIKETLTDKKLEREYLEGFSYIEHQSYSLIDYIQYDFSSGNKYCMAFSKRSKQINSNDNQRMPKLYIDADLTPQLLAKVVQGEPKAFINILEMNNLWLFNASIGVNIVNSKEWKNTSYSDNCELTSQINCIFDVKSKEPLQLNNMLEIADTRLISKRYRSASVLYGLAHIIYPLLNVWTLHLWHKSIQETHPMIYDRVKDLIKRPQ